MIPTPFLDCREGIEFSQNDLPHWHQPDRFQFLTWNLGDALPNKALVRLKKERRSWCQLHPHPWTEEEQAYYFDRFTDRVDRWLALGRGEAIFRNPKYSAELASILMFHEGRKSRMDAFVIMPNHVHCLVQLIGDSSISSLLHSWRSYSALQLNRLRGKTGKLWSEDYWDRVIRTPAHYWRTRRYIEKNPQMAGLAAGSYRLWLRQEPLWNGLQKEGYGVRPPWGSLAE